ncbi:30S ribosomal protein S8 [bacterium]|nr:30S ribosomal protein S8 [bacterium]NIN92290.1 30S ribosomal protein S8 [bacterium]NIO18412.1 30S ribosomal protein S8 [bacterium]NIO73405.1 30S ribosomal protein S8 [bacterium]
MSISDPIADMLTRIRNANQKMKGKVDIPASKLKEKIVKVLKEEGYIANYKFISDRKQGILRVYLKYTPEQDRVIKGLRRISRPGRRFYCGADELPRVYRGLGVAIISTSQGVMSAKKCRESNLGGEVICYVW